MKRELSRPEELIGERIERDSRLRAPAADVTRRVFLGSAAGAAAAAAFLRSPSAFAKGPELAARPPSGFVPLSAPGRVVKVK